MYVNFRLESDVFYVDKKKKMKKVVWGWNIVLEMLFLFWFLIRILIWVCDLKYFEEK